MVTETPPTTAEKLDRLAEILRELESVVVAFSGGADSVLLMDVARDVLGDRALADRRLAGLSVGGDRRGL